MSHGLELDLDMDTLAALIREAEARLADDELEQQRVNTSILLSQCYTSFFRYIVMFNEHANTVIFSTRLRKQ